VRYDPLILSADGEMLVLELRDLYSRFTNDVIATAAFGIGIDSLKNPTNEFYTTGQEAFKTGHLRMMKHFACLMSPKLVQVSHHIAISYTIV
jgi:cytochrome P450 family 9